MKLIILFMFSILAVNSACGVEAGNASSPDKSGPQLASSYRASQADLFTPSLSALRTISLATTQSREDVFIIGELALAQAAINLPTASDEGQELKLVDDRNFTSLYSDMSSAFGMAKIPIKLFKYGMQNPQDLGNINLNLDNNITAPPENYFEPVSPNLPTIKISDGLNESRSGVTVIWSP